MKTRLKGIPVPRRIKRDGTVFEIDLGRSGVSEDKSLHMVYKPIGSIEDFQKKDDLKGTVMLTEIKREN